MSWSWALCFWIYLWIEQNNINNVKTCSFCIRSSGGNCVTHFHGLNKSFSLREAESERPRRWRTAQVHIRCQIYICISPFNYSPVKTSILMILFYPVQLFKEDETNWVSIAAVTPWRSNGTEGMKQLHQGRGQLICNEGVSAHTSCCWSIQLASKL